MPLKNQKNIKAKTNSYKTRILMSPLWDIFVQELTLTNETKKSLSMFFV